MPEGRPRLRGRVGGSPLPTAAAIAGLLLLAPRADAEPRPDSVRALRDAVRSTGAQFSEPPGPIDAPGPADADAHLLASGVGGYLAVAAAHSPEVRAAFERWEASVHRIARARTLPEPRVGFGVFLQSVEAGSGPRPARLSLQQAFPWPTALTAGSDAAAAEARAAQRRFDAAILTVGRRVQEAYWALWAIRATRETHHQHLDVLDGLSATLRARLEVGQASLADLQQVDLARARLADDIESMREDEIGAAATLRSVVGLRSPASTPTPDAPGPPELPGEPVERLVQRALAHPAIAGVERDAEAADHAARAAGAQRLPSAMLELEWMPNGPAMPGMQPTGQDMVIVGAGLSLPLWQRTYAADVAARRATADALRSDRRLLADRAAAAVEQQVARIRDAARRVSVTEGTLLPQAEATYTSLLGSYVTGGSTVAQVLLAQRDLLELRARLDEARAAHAAAWATLEEQVGGEVARQASAEEAP